MTLKSITDALEHCKSDSAPQVVKYLVLFLFVTMGGCTARALSSVIRGKLSALHVSEWTIDLMKKVLFTRNDYLLQNEPEKIVRRIARDTETATSYLLSLWVEAPFAILGLCMTLWLMFFGSPKFLETNLNLAHQQCNILLATIIVCMAPLHLLFLLYNKKRLSAGI